MVRRKAFPRSQVDAFSPAREQFEAMVQWLGGDQRVPQTHGELEQAILEEGTELLRQLLQARLQVLFERERADLAKRPRAEGMEVRARSRQLMTQLGRVEVRRHGHRTGKGGPAKFPLDERLNLPTDLYSHPLREHVLAEAQRGAWGPAVERVSARTSGHVPKRQAEQLAVHATQDFEAFYAQLAPANDALGGRALLVASCDSKGIRMRPEALREGTRKAAEAEQRQTVGGDPMAAQKLRQHDRRMAIVTAVWEQPPHRRTARDIIGSLRKASRRKRRRRDPSRSAQAPQLHAKRLRASVEMTGREGIAEMFDELDRRDPSRTRTAIVLVDGETNQKKSIAAEGVSRRRQRILVLDFIHVLSYLWRAGSVICGKNAAKTDSWVRRFSLQLLTQPVHTVIRSIQRSAEQHRISARRCLPVRICLQYFQANAPCMQYADFLAAGFPIATGVIEGACRHLIQDRLGITGARWGLAGAEAILKLRALQSNGDWTRYWQFHSRQEASRNYARAA
jgi:hypothetical protein